MSKFFGEQGLSGLTGPAAVRKVLLLLAAVLVFVCSAGGEEAGGGLEDLVPLGGDRYSCTYDGVKHDLIVDLPDSAEDSPLVIMLHGYGNSAESFRTGTAFEKDANPRGYTVVYVTGASNPADRTSAAGWNYDLSPQGNKDLEFLTALVSFVRDRYHTDGSRTYIVGFSNGAFMAHRLAISAADTFGAVVSVAGTMQESVWEDRPETRTASLFQITGEKDDVVPKESDGSARYTRSPAVEDLIDYYASANGLTLEKSEEVGKGSVLTRYSGAFSDRQLWHLFVKDGHHCWPDQNVTGINTNELILDFLDGLSEQRQ